MSNQHNNTTLATISKTLATSLIPGLALSVSLFGACTISTKPLRPNLRGAIGIGSSSPAAEVNTYANNSSPANSSNTTTASDRPIPVASLPQTGGTSMATATVIGIHTDLSGSISLDGPRYYRIYMKTGDILRWKTYTQHTSRYSSSLTVHYTDSLGGKLSAHYIGAYEGLGTEAHSKEQIAYTHKELPGWVNIKFHVKDEGDGVQYRFLAPQAPVAEGGPIEGISHPSS